MEKEIMVDSNNNLLDPDLYNYWTLADNRIFYLAEDITLLSLELQKSIIAINLEDMDIPVEERVPIKILIDSPGGYLDETMSLCSIIEMSKTPVYTVNVAESSSGAALILMSGHKRFAFPFSSALIHSGSTSGAAGTFEQTEEHQKKYKKDINQMREYILAHTKISKTTFGKNKSKEWYFDANEQLASGIVDEIITDISVICGGATK